MSDEELMDELIDLNLEDESLGDGWDGTGGPRVPPGHYVATIVEAGVKPSKSSGAPTLNVTFEVSDGEQKGNTIRGWYSLKREGKGAEWTRKRLVCLLKACGLPLGQFQASSLVGRSLHIEVYSEPYNDLDENGNTVSKDSTKVRGERAIAGAATQTVTASAAPARPTAPTATTKAPAAPPPRTPAAPPPRPAAARR